MSLKEAKIQVVAVSYDSVEILAEFWKRTKILYPLLSDPKSKTIDAYGIRNREAKGRFDGIPYPGTFLVGQDGVVRAKLFYSGYKKRHQAKDIIEASKKVTKELFKDRGKDQKSNKPEKGT